MLQVIALTTALLIVLTGMYVLARGDWHSFGLKFAGVVFSTSGAIWLLCAGLFFGNSASTCPPDLPPGMCMTFEIYHILRNVAFLIFHIAIGRDAIQFKKRDRRGTLCRKNSSKQPLPL